VNQGLKKEIDKPPTNPQKNKIHTYYIMPPPRRVFLGVLGGGTRMIRPTSILFPPVFCFCFFLFPVLA